MQTAYKEKVDYIASIRPEIDAQKEEVEEAETRSRHLKMQLEDMGRKAEEQNRAMKELALQLAEEKVKVQELTASRGVGEEEQEDTTPRRNMNSRKRGSAGSASDSGFESDLEYAESIMSSSAGNGGSGAETPLTPPTPTLTFTQHTADVDARNWHHPVNAKRPVWSARQSTASSSQLSGRQVVVGGEGAAVDQLRGENRDLRRQMEEMQAMLQGCIEFVDVVKG